MSNEIRLIDANALYDEVEAIGGCGAEPKSWEDGWDKAIDSAIDLIEHALTVDNEPVRHGYWTECAIYKGKKYYSCSECEHTYPIYDNTRYCQHCGAKMDGRYNG